MSGKAKKEMDLTSFLDEGVKDTGDTSEPKEENYIGNIMYTDEEKEVLRQQEEAYGEEVDDAIIDTFKGKPDIFKFHGEVEERTADEGVIRLKGMSDEKYSQMDQKIGQYAIKWDKKRQAHKQTLKQKSKLKPKPLSSNPRAIKERQRRARLKAMQLVREKKTKKNGQGGRRKRRRKTKRKRRKSRKRRKTKRRTKRRRR